MSQKAEMEDSKGRLERFKQWILPPNDPNAPVREDIRFMPTRLGAFFLNPPKASFLIIRYTLILFVIAIIWACFSPIDEITRPAMYRSSRIWKAVSSVKSLSGSVRLSTRIRLS